MRIIIKQFAIITLFLPLVTGCKKYLDTALPADTISQQNAYVSDNSISAVVTGNFLAIGAGGNPFGGSSGSNLTNLTGLYMDELQNLSPGGAANNIAFYKDAIQPANTAHWTSLYKEIFGVNAAIEGILNTTATLYYRNQWLGESYFTRAFLYFYLTNLYGDVPLALTSDYATNNILSRAPQSQVYQQIIADLKQAQGLLNSSYTDAYGASTPTTHRVRPDRYVASALLAKTYLYTQKWDSAGTQADSVINNTSYALLPTSQVFTSNGKETIWALAPYPSSPANGYALYINGMPATLTGSSTPQGTYNVLACLDTALVNAFEAGDNRFTNWVRSVPVAGSSPAFTYYFPNKYSSPTVNSVNDMILRLAEIYLIRAEARAHLNNISGSQSDLNMVRTRAGLPNTTAADQASLLDAIAKERRIELFTECSNRFFDLKRTGAVDGVMTAFAPQKGATWSSFMQLFPIPTNDLLQDPNLTPNPGYQQ